MEASEPVRGNNFLPPVAGLSSLSVPYPRVLPFRLSRLRYYCCKFGQLLANGSPVRLLASNRPNRLFGVLGNGRYPMSIAESDE